MLVHHDFPTLVGRRCPCTWRRGSRCRSCRGWRRRRVIVRGRCRRGWCRCVARVVLLVIARCKAEKRYGGDRSNQKLLHVGSPS
ncbi:hypothetical protein Oant_1729 [Brucella anthropi ATCC 49188]|uniref:Uncharacterized protein n=1 Tax=Brucella anthropi (strain ATCC 49188 / DSM 6882 / CCUG 24695 / JCM 21032 / LMG 3331 / NBRC 15819 / NCTC 12168 / Alc 37) TaxID=439375 RepID=A6WZP1_BRUA4|nr:hypothetical protein Oant_1729 [Brucella anthropi ATCC 49188]